jgi:hypothetical protein
MRFVKRRDPATRPTVKPQGVIIFHTATANWRDRVRALTAAQAAEQNKDSATPRTGLSQLP